MQYQCFSLLRVIGVLLSHNYVSPSVCSVIVRTKKALFFFGFTSIFFSSESLKFQYCSGIGVFRKSFEREEICVCGRGRNGN